MISRFIRTITRDTDLWHDDVWIVDSTLVECARSRPTVKRSRLAGWAGYGYCASHSRFFWGLRLHLLCTPGGLPIAWALANPKTDEREVLAGMLTQDADLLTTRPGQTIVGDKGYVSKHLDAFMADHGLTLLRPSHRNRKPRPGEHLLKPIRQLIESVNDTLKRPARPRTPRGQDPIRGPGPRRTTHPGPDRSHLAQPGQRNTHHPMGAGRQALAEEPAFAPGKKDRGILLTTSNRAGVRSGRRKA
ncbi:transposase [Streptomyces sp. NPDC000656]|uniref:transposase n=1 Tax=unclassified Streptomyces TaxID=2593676 RepID=UPI0036A11177